MAMQPYIQLNAHCTGKSHIARSKPCEDYSLSYGDSSLSAAVISDGHGDSNCFRSAVGAQFACEICLNLFRQFQGITSHITDIGSCDFESDVLLLERELVSKWKQVPFRRTNYSRLPKTSALSTAWGIPSSALTDARL